MGHRTTLGCTFPPGEAIGQTTSAISLADYLNQVVPICKYFNFSNVASLVADAVGDASEEVDGDSRLGALGDEDKLVKWHGLLLNNKRN